MVKGAVLITAGFKEIEDVKGEALEKENRKDCPARRSADHRSEYLRFCYFFFWGQRLFYAGILPVGKEGFRADKPEGGGMSAILPGPWADGAKDGCVLKSMSLGNRLKGLGSRSF